MAETQELIVLRFRDIEVPSGETIAKHKTAIAQHRFCWWGWLFRDYERNPHSELAQLAQRLSGANGYSIALLDTGRSKVYQATCIEIRATPNLQRSPNVAATPAYYNDKRAPAWFKLTEIVEADPALIVGKMCHAMPSASDECFIDLLGQKVTHLRDLRRQEVTLWVLG